MMNGNVAPASPSQSNRSHDPPHPPRKGSGHSDSSYHSASSDRHHNRHGPASHLAPLNLQPIQQQSGSRNGSVPPSPVASSSGTHSPRISSGQMSAGYSPQASPRAQQSSHHLGTAGTHRKRSSLDARDRSSSMTGSTDKRSSAEDRFSSSPSSRSQMCAKCQQPMTGQFVRALGSVYHLDCFRCKDCNKIVAAKFFPIDSNDAKSALKQVPLCETDYFRRLNLLCANCGCALRGSYITALDKKYHVEHFTCSICPTVFGPQDSYYEHDGRVYCHFHYSTRFAVKCTGCRTAILKQFVEINRNSVDEHWHPECYMIHKFWHVKLAPVPPPKASDSSQDNTDAQEEQEEPAKRNSEESDYEIVEARETPVSLRAKQKKTEEQVYRIWTVLSSFEESSAACISEMLRHVSTGQYIEGVKMAEKFVIHVETLFCSIDDLSVHFLKAEAKPIAYVREARMLCKKVVNFFSLLSHTHETGARKITITQDLLSLVTGLAHYLKILIRIALTSALRLEQEHKNSTAIAETLNRLDKLARDPAASQIAATKKKTQPDSRTATTQHGYSSLSKALSPTNGLGEATTDLCEGCRQTVEDECARHGTGLRWHLPCVRCTQCGRVSRKESEAQPDDPPESKWLREFVLEPTSDNRLKGGLIFCPDCAPPNAVHGFERVTRLEQYAYLLCVALNKLYSLLRQRGVVTSDEASDRSLYDVYRDSTDIKRMKSVNLDRKLSSTMAKIPKRSTVVQSPSGRSAQASETSSKPPVPSRKDQPVYDPQRGSTVPRSAAPSPVTSSNQAEAPLSPPIPSVQAAQSSTATSPSQPTRPEFHRQTTAVHIVDEQAGGAPQQEGPGLGGSTEPTQDEDGITLADLPHVMEAEQAREQHRALPQRSGLLLSELSALEYFIIKHVAALMLANDGSPLAEVVPLDDLLDIIDARKNTFWGKLFKGNNDKKSNKKKGVFGVPLDALVERNGADSMHGAGPGSLRIPSFVDDVISAMKQMDMSIEGIFRKNGNIRRLKDLSEALDRDPSSVNLSDDNPVQLAALLKRFLRDLPDPLLTFKLFSLFLGTQRIEDPEQRKQALHLICCLLPKAHRDTMEALFVFLKWVASFSHVDEETGSKMDLHNLATVISPNILYPKGKEPFREESFSAVRAVHELLELQDDFWLVPEQFAPILNEPDLFTNPSQLTSKEILARAEKYVRGGGQRRNGSNGFSSRGEVHRQRPDLSPPFVAASPVPPSGMRSPSASTPNGFQGSPRTGRERPMSFSTTPAYPDGSSNMHPGGPGRGRLAPISTDHAYSHGLGSGGGPLVGSPSSPSFGSGSAYSPNVPSPSPLQQNHPHPSYFHPHQQQGGGQPMNRYDSRSHSHDGGSRQMANAYGSPRQGQSRLA